MAGKSPIEWTGFTWNPVVGCSLKSPGCTNCYAMPLAARLERMGNAPHYAGLTAETKAGPVFNGKVALAPDHILLEPLRRRKPTTWFVNSMGDLFHESVPDEWIDRVFAVMALSPQHTFQVLTKRSARMRAYFEGRRNIFGRASNVLQELNHSFDEDAHQLAADRLDYFDSAGIAQNNVWLGVSAEDQRRADERVPDLLATPAAVRFVSAEPLLGPIDFTCLPDGVVDGIPIAFNALASVNHVAKCLDWIIVGGESGPGARPMHPDWARSIRDQCAAAGVPFFFKQWGAYRPEFPAYPAEYDIDGDDLLCSGLDFPAEGVLYRDGYFFNGLSHQPHVNAGAYWMELVGKKRAGRLLDGVLHDAMPARASA
ncbi:MAG TPA: phage Gp37/Gp68 family protein [Kaistia sp.]|nr:phage Gp37/Gp68 family protein [Kaistia sp.]